MTRETKIGLIVGLGVIIFIGILISDYLSVAQRQQSADINEMAFGESPAEPADNPYNMVPLTNRAGSRSEQANPPRRTEPRPAPDRRFEVDELVIDTRDLTPAIETPGSSDPVNAASRGGSRTGSGDEAAGGGVNHTGPEPRRQPRRDRPQASQATSGTSDRTAPSQAKSGTHHVGRGETLSKIAARHYGDANLWRVIHEANRDKVPDPKRLRQGVALTIPPRNQANTPERGNGTARDPVPEPQETRPYTIQRGDSLSKLAERFFGSQRRIDQLLELNRDVIDDPDRILVGMEIRVPAD